MLEYAPILITAYPIGPIPLALLVSCLLLGVDIRQIDAGNMGVINVTYVLGLLPGFIIAGAVLLARTAEGSSMLQLAARIANVLAHHFPILVGCGEFDQRSPLSSSCCCRSKPSDLF